MPSTTVVHLTDYDLKSLSCPLKDDVVTSEHPRVYLTLDEKNQARCPYCSTLYIKANDES